MSDWWPLIAETFGPIWPYLVVITIGFLPTEVWRVSGVLFGQKLDERSPWLQWVRLVATALVAGVVMKLVVTPTGALAAIPLVVRAGAIIAGIAVMVLARRSIFAGLIAGELTLLIGALLAGVG